MYQGRSLKLILTILKNKLQICIIQIEVLLYIRCKSDILYNDEDMVRHGLYILVSFMNTIGKSLKQKSLTVEPNNRSIPKIRAKSAPTVRT